MDEIVHKNLKERESIEGNPRIKLSTIHAMKGGGMITLLILRIYTSRMEGKNPEDEHRAFW